MNELELFIANIKTICGVERTLTIEQARNIVKEINEFLYAKYPDIGQVVELGQNWDYFSDFHKFWQNHHREILDLQIDDTACRAVADALNDIYVRTEGRAFREIYDTNHLSAEEICRVRFLTANQDFRGSRSFRDLSEVYLEDNHIFDIGIINSDPEDFVRKLGITGLSQSDKRVSYAKKITEFLLSYNSEPYDIIGHFNNDVRAFRNALLSYEGTGYGNKKTDMFIRDMIVLGVWKNVTNFDCIDVASDVNTMKVALRTGILRSAIPLVSSFLDIFCYQYGYVDEMNALAWRKVWQYWKEIYPEETIDSPCLLDYFVYNVVGKQFCKENLILFQCEHGHTFKWHSARNRRCQVCAAQNVRAEARVIGKKLPCTDTEGRIAIRQTDFVRSGIVNPNIEMCPFSNICATSDTRRLNPPKSISILGQTGWTTAYSDKDCGGGGLMA